MNPDKKKRGSKKEEEQGSDDVLLGQALRGYVKDNMENLC